MGQAMKAIDLETGMTELFYVEKIIEASNGVEVLLPPRELTPEAQAAYEERDRRRFEQRRKQRRHKKGFLRGLAMAMNTLML